jgi:two-component system KDP operon response regulator KdpE
MSRVLVLDEEPRMRRLLQSGFAREGHEVDVVGDAETALERLARGGFDMVVLDVGAPGCGSSDVVGRFRQWSDLPLIVLSVPRSLEHKVGLLRAGADDFVEKPFAIEELMARAHAVLRRFEAKAESPVLSFGEELEVDLCRRLVLRGGEALHLTPTEYRLLEVMVRNAKKLLTQEFLLRRVWGPGYANEHEYLRTYVAQLRAKLGDRASRPRWIATEPRVGYRWLVEPNADDSNVANVLTLG